MSTVAETTIEADPEVPIIRMRREFNAGAGRTLLRTQSLVDSLVDRDSWPASGVEVGVNEGYAKLEETFTDGTV